MTDSGIRTVAITGSSGYLGGLLRGRLTRDGLRVISLGRTNIGSESRRYVIEESPSPDLLSEVDALVHCAYDMKVRREQDIWAVNVEGSRRLLEYALSSGVRRTIVLSSMSAFEGTQQLYGRSKLAIEGIAARNSAISVRPGIVYGPNAGGMAGALSALTRLPVVPLVASRSHQFTLHEDDFTAAISALLRATNRCWDSVGLANPVPVSFKDLIAGLARLSGRNCRTVPVDWRFVMAGLRTCETLRIDLPFRADSLVGLANPAPMVPNLEIWQELGITLRRFGQPVPGPPSNSHYSH
jgi:nucleoside-diphosphate-sugar epimerase